MNNIKNVISNLHLIRKHYKNEMYKCKSMDDNYIEQQKNTLVMKHMIDLTNINRLKFILIDEIDKQLRDPKAKEISKIKILNIMYLLERRIFKPETKYSHVINKLVNYILFVIEDSEEKEYLNIVLKNLKGININTMEYKFSTVDYNSKEE